MGGLVIAGDRSGSGKTTVTLAMLAALHARNLSVQPFKVGPDYIDPMFHRAITGRPAYNLDPVLTSESYVKQCFDSHRYTTSYAIVEGVMGLFDGAGGTDYASTAHIARLLDCPVVLVVDCGRLSRSLAAIVHGYATLDFRINLAGVILNRVGSDRHLAMLKAAMQSLKMPVLGVLRRDEVVTLPDRHLGLVPTEELADWPERVRQLAALGQRCFDWEALEQVFRHSQSSSKKVDFQDGLDKRILLDSSTPARPFQSTMLPLKPYSMASHVSDANLTERPSQRPLRIGVARDLAFNFYYEDNLKLLADLGAELVPFSPLKDETLPRSLHGLILGGGFPEVFAEALSQNVSMRAGIAHSLKAELPVYAECGGLMYLCQSLTTFEGDRWPMVGALTTHTMMTGKLTLGYRQVTTQQISPLVEPGQQFWGHEFHRSAIAPASPHPLYRLTSYPTPYPSSPPLSAEGWSSESIHASYVHLHWGTQPELVKRFVAACNRFKDKYPVSP